ncbi:hypothetical protein [Sinisalibacter aestuarii]|uniref:Uncharacterized protein n=1 Tax=Sinisalibacter aestuarii TaxID=2949426 RepID=A0ABQ5LX50_9RHOB|nr:hypothetical protein [Sinisalibacter aestuarii]GKY89499.1 hypothetical protein STA1M1_33680 [Sinisalibacter aestuarii]
MNDVIFIGNRTDTALCSDAGIRAYAPPLGLLAERVLAERMRCRILAMRESTFLALPKALARELREGSWPRLSVLPEDTAGTDSAPLTHSLRQQAARDLGGKS